MTRVQRDPVKRWFAYAAVSAADSVLAGLDRPWARRARWVTKPALMPVLAATVRPPAGSATAAALAGSWVGDVGLLLPGTGGLLSGIGGFAGAHVAYLRAIDALPPGSRAKSSTRLRVIAALGLPGTVVAPTLLRGTRNRPLLRLPLAAYAGLVQAVGVRAVLRGGATSAPGGAAVEAGGKLFVVSDALVALSLFAERRPPAVRVAAMATYTLAQALLGAGLSRGLAQHYVDA